MNHKRAVEELSHFQCGRCKKWWTIGDAPKEKKKWFCPWCGEGEESLQKKKINKGRRK